MGEIYAQAKKVRIWLGEGDEITSKVFKFLCFAAEMKRTNGTLSYGLVKEGMSKISGTESSQTLGGVLCSPWFGRRWIIQEADLGHSATVHQGNYKISWQVFAEGLIALLDVVHDLQLSDVGRYSPAVADTMSKTKMHDILDCLWDFDENACSDPRDRIFALYGFASASNAHGKVAPIPVD